MATTRFACALALLLALSVAGDDSSAPPMDSEELYGPPEWPGKCSDGTQQSPVNLRVPDPLPTEGGPAQLNWSSSAQVSVIITSAGVRRVDIPPGSTTTICGNTYDLAHYHFHAPSEHAINGQRAYAELHLVHNDTATGGNAVLGILFNRSGSEPGESMAAYLNNLPDPQPGQTVASEPFNLDLNAAIGSLLPSSTDQGRIMAYNGSLTTPPCTEPVKWFVSSYVPPLQDSQILDFMHSINPANGLSVTARPLQEMNDRVVETM